MNNSTQTKENLNSLFIYNSLCARATLFPNKTYEEVEVILGIKKLPSKKISKKIAI